MVVPGHESPMADYTYLLPEDELKKVSTEVTPNPTGWFRKAVLDTAGWGILPKKFR